MANKWKKERTNTNKCSCEEEEFLSPFANFCALLSVVWRECLFLKGFLSLALLLLVCLLASPGSLIEPWRNCSCSSLSRAMDPWVVVVVGVEEEEEEEETELDLEFIFFLFFFPSVCECWAPRLWRLHIYCWCGEKLRKRKKESFGLCRERERDAERDREREVRMAVLFCF